MAAPIFDRNDPAWEPLSPDPTMVEEAMFAVVVSPDGMVTIDVRKGVPPTAVLMCLQSTAAVMAEGGGMYLTNPTGGVDEAERFANGETNG